MSSPKQGSSLQNSDEDTDEIGSDFEEQNAQKEMEI